MSRSITFQIGEYYHVYNRGVDKRTIFERTADYLRFLKLLYLCNSEKPVNMWLTQELKGPTFQFKDVERESPLIAIGAYCLMPNHFHILLKETQDGGITKFMRKLGTAYTMYFNLTRERTGTLFQGKFKAVHADSDEYLKYLFSYIHLNPKNPKRFPYSSYFDYLGQHRELNLILNISEFPDYFPTPKEFEESINDWISIRSGLALMRL